jgi:hypothetical protein
MLEEEKVIYLKNNIPKFICRTEDILERLKISGLSVKNKTFDVPNTKREC